MPRKKFKYGAGFASAMRSATSASRVLKLLNPTRLMRAAIAPTLLSSLVSRTIATNTEFMAFVAKKPPPFQKPASKALNNIRVTESDGEKKSRTSKSMQTARSPDYLSRPLGEVVKLLLKGEPKIAARRRATTRQDNNTATPDVPAGASFTTHSFSSSAGSRKYKLYIPKSAANAPRGLLLMLHGCTQTPEDFAAGTNMNSVAEKRGLLVAYPAQTRASNSSSCWNWFEGGHQHRDEGEPAILAGLARKLIEEFKINDQCVYVAGLSAGAAMAVVLGKTYPDVFRAVGVHSGLAYKSASNVMSALAVMRGVSGAQTFLKAVTGSSDTHHVPTIIFHGSNDRTVHPSNAERIIDAAHGAGSKRSTVAGSKNGRSFKRTVIASQNGLPLVESWMIDKAGHAWSGGKSSGSFTDASGPDASAEMVRFFLNKP
jgi:poly(hydroxyalkanoate) depolymerase family esterase